MSNLGWYQRITTWSKKVGGPQNLLIITAIGGYVIGKSIEICKKEIVKKQKQYELEKNIETHTVTMSGKSNDGLIFEVGDRFKILESDKDSVLIEKIGDKNNPYFVDKKLLEETSDYV